MPEFDPELDELEAKKRALAQFNPDNVMPHISMIESSGGKFRNHAMNEQGVQAGTKSVSSYGLMPNTIYEFTKRNKEFQQTPQGQAVMQSQGNPEQINSITQDIANDDQIMHSLLQEQDNRLRPHYEGYKVDPEVANVLANRRGVSGAIKSMKDNSYLSDPYVQKYLQLKKLKTPVKDPLG